MKTTIFADGGDLDRHREMLAEIEKLKMENFDLKEKIKRKDQEIDSLIHPANYD